MAGCRPAAAAAAAAHRRRRPVGPIHGSAAARRQHPTSHHERAVGATGEQHPGAGPVRRGTRPLLQLSERHTDGLVYPVRHRAGHLFLPTWIALLLDDAGKAVQLVRRQASRAAVDYPGAGVCRCGYLGSHRVTLGHLNVT